MCSIFGIYSSNKKNKILENLTNSALKLTSYRGPDSSSSLTKNNFSCGVNRLSIEALKFGGQPIEDERFVAGFNGEIFNYKTLISMYNLKNVNSEIKLILSLWRIMDIKFVEKLRGQFAIFIYDKIEENIYIFRDPFGIRPVFYSSNKIDFIFSSEIKSIVNTKLVQTDIDERSLAQTSFFWTNIDKQTSFKNIFSLPPGHYLKWNKKEFVLNRHYTFPTLHKNLVKKKSLDLFTQLKESVNRQMHGEVSFGCYLSGGIDSSALAYLLSRKKKLNTFSVSFDNSEYDESSFQNLMAKKIYSNHFNLKIKEKMIAENFEKVVYHAETFLFRTAPVPMYLLSKKVKENGIKVIYSGEGADEILFGYDIFFENRIRNFWKRDPESRIRPILLKKLYQYLPQFKNSRYFSIIKDFYKSTLISDSEFYSHLSRWAQFRHVLSFFKIDNMEKIEENLLLDLKKSLPENYKNLETDEKAQYLEINTLLSNYLLSSQGDKVSMANSVEGRYPFLDEDFVNSACSFGSKNLAPGLISKEHFRKNFVDVLPKEIINRPKTAYQAPEAKSFVNEKFTSDIVLEFQDNFNDLDFINKKNFTSLIKKFKDPLSSQRIGFRENMAFIMGLSYFALKKSVLKWQNGE